MRLHVKDTSGKTIASAFDDLSKVEKFELTQDQYSKRTDTVKAYLQVSTYCTLRYCCLVLSITVVLKVMFFLRLQRNKLGKYNEEEMEKLRIEKETEDKEEADKLATMKVGDRYEA